MNVLFLAKEPLFYMEYAARLENHGVPFWTAHTTNDFHVMVDRMTFDVVFADYNFMDFSKFDVYKHIKSKAGKFVFLFLNELNQERNLFIHWEDKITEHCPDLWSKELETLLRLVLNQPFTGEYVLESEKVENLLLQKESEKQNPFQIQTTATIIDSSDEYENHEIVLEDEQDLFSDTSFEYEEQNTKEKKLIEDFLTIKKNYN
jgi:DNA-binding NarL/FixJ family response regulator